MLKDKLNAYIDKRGREILQSAGSFEMPEDYDLYHNNLGKKISSSIVPGQEKSPGALVIDLGHTFEKFFTRNIVHVCFGEDVSDMQIEIDIPRDAKSSEFYRKTVSLNIAIRECFTQMVNISPTKNFRSLY